MKNLLIIILIGIIAAIGIAGQKMKPEPANKLTVPEKVSSAQAGFESEKARVEITGKEKTNPADYSK